MDYLTSERDDPNILDMDFRKFYIIKSLLDKSSIRERFLEVLPKEIFSTEKYNLMEVEGYQGNMTPGKWLLRYLGNCGGRVSDLICWFEEINLERALICLKEEEPLQIIEQPEPTLNVNEGGRISIRCRASGYPHPEYQWLKDDEELLLETEQVLSIPSAKVEDSGTYVCKAFKRNADSSISYLPFDPVVVVVLPCKSSNFFNFSRQNSDNKQCISTNPDVQHIQTKPKEFYEQNILSTKCPKSEKIVILKQPCSYGKIAQGSIVWFKCIAKSSHPVNYQWYRNGRLLDGQTSTKLLIDELYPDQETGSRKFQFFCKVYNENDEVISNVATVELSEPDDQTKYVAEDKFAFLIANDKYEAYEEDLVTPAVDATDLAKLLNSINFKVIVLRNLNLREMRSAFQAFCRMLRAGSYAVLFFAGHGFECYGQTYLQPIDCSENVIPEESMCTEYILQQLQETRPSLIVLLIDACRKRPPELGYAPIEYDACMGNNTVYGYATTYLNGAYESNERNSFFVKHLKKYITHDKSIQEIIFRVQKDFDTEPQTRNIQNPVIESSLCAARKLCDELQNPVDMTTYQLPCWFYQERNPIQKRTEIFDEFKCCFIIEIKDHMDVYLNGVDVNFYIYVKEDANLVKLREGGLTVLLDIPGFRMRKAVLFKNATLNLGARNLIMKEEVLGLQNLRNPKLKAQLIVKYEKNPIMPIEFSFTVEKIRGMNIFFW